MKKHFTLLFLLIFAFIAFSGTNATAQSNWSPDEKETIEQLLGVTFTGNAAQDATLYEQAKRNLQQSNPQAYAAHFGAVKRIGTYWMIPGFTYTGVEATDRVNYKNAKIDLYNNYPALYAEYFPTHSNQKVYMTQSEYNSLPADKKALVDAQGLSIIDGQ